MKGRGEQGSAGEVGLILLMANQTHGQNELLYSPQVVQDALKVLTEKFPFKQSAEGRNAGILAVVNWGKAPSTCSWRGTGAWWGFAGCSSCASLCQELLGATSTCWERAGSNGEKRDLDVKPWQGSPRVSLAQGCVTSVSLCAQPAEVTLLFVSTAKPCACRNPQERCAALGEAGRSG